MRTLVLLPGWTARENDYKKLIASRPKNIKISVVKYQELLNFGQLEKFNDKLLDYLKKHKLSKIILAGVSLGGIFAVKFAASCPEKVKLLVLVDAEGVPGGENIFQAVLSLIHSRQTQLYQPRVPLKNIWEFFKNIPLQLQLGIYGYKGDVINEAKKISVPTVIIWGEKDCLVPVSQAMTLQNLILKSKLIVLKDLGHDWICFFPEKFWENIK